MAKDVVINQKVWTHDRIHTEIKPLIDNGISYIESLLFFANKHNIEIETVADIVKKSSVLKDNIKKEAEKTNLLKRV
jgi:predicted type IV restriction endonuclease